MAKPTCEVCGQQCEPKTLHGMKVDAVGRNQQEFLSVPMLEELAEGKRLTVCQEPSGGWLWIHPTDADEPRHRNRRLSSGQVEALAEGIDSAFTHGDEPEDAKEACARAEIKAEGRLDDRRERHFDEHGHFGPGHDPGPD